MNFRGWFGLVVGWVMALTTLTGALLTPSLAYGRTPEGVSFDSGMISGGEAADTPVKISAFVLRPQVAPDGESVIAVVLDHAEGYHSWPSIEQNVLPEAIAEFAIRTEIGFKDADGKTLPRPKWLASFGPVQWPEPKPAKVADVTTGKGTIDVPTYGGRAIAYVPIVIAPDAPAGKHTLEFAVSYQACNDFACTMPEDAPVQVEIEVLAAGAVASVSADAQTQALFAGFDQTYYAKARESGGSPKKVDFDVFGLKFKVDTAGPTGLLLLLLVAALGGFLLNLTPCVLPVIPLKIMGLSASSGNPARCFMMGVLMSMGVVAFFMGIAVAMVSLSGFSAISSLFQTKWFSLVVGALIGFFGLSMLGLFTFRLPKVVYSIDPSQESAGGAFMFGVMTAVLSTPCTAPLMGAAAAWATTQSPFITLATFAAIGAGMALPYLILAANPKWVKRIPKSGPASELVKQVMGLLLIGVAVFFAGTGLASLIVKPPEPPTRAYWWIIAGLAVLAGGWLMYKTFRITPALSKRLVFGLVGLLLASGGVLAARTFTDKGPVNWIYYTPERFEKARTDGKVVVIDFTAEWCLNCKAIEKAVLFRPEVAKLLNSDQVVAMKIDLTGDNTAGKAKLKEVGRVAIPLLAVFGPGLDQPFLSDAYTPQQVIDAISTARGDAQAAGVTNEGGSRASTQ